MRVVSDDPDVVRLLQGIAKELTAVGGFVADDFTVHERAGDFWCSITDQPGVADRWARVLEF